MRVIQKSGDGVTASGGESLHRQQKKWFGIGRSDSYANSRWKIAKQRKTADPHQADKEDSNWKEKSGEIWRTGQPPKEKSARRKTGFHAVTITALTSKKSLHECHAETVAGHFGI